MLKTAPQAQQMVCRFCGKCTPPGESVCTQADCMQFARDACGRVLPCGHRCGGIRDEAQCLPCLHDSCTNGTSPRQQAVDLCMICQTSSLASAPTILLGCGHAFHWHCCRSVIERRWSGPRVSFAFMRCPICQQDVVHPSLESLLVDARNLRDNVRRMALTRLQYEAQQQQQIPLTGDVDLADSAMEQYAYYMCHQCGKPYYGGAARCEQEVDRSSLDDVDPTQLVCGSCSNTTSAQSCVHHGSEFLAFKCRFCCSLAVFFCFGTTHFCTACHDDHARLTQMPPINLPQCPAGPRAVQLSGCECPLHVQHPATGHEYALGCAICLNALTF